MTEQEWLRCADPDILYMDRFATTPKPMRKLTLFACGCCRKIWEQITDPRCRLAVGVSELEADGLALPEQFDSAFDAVEAACDEIVPAYPHSLKQTAAHAAEMALRAPSDAAYPVACVLATHERSQGQIAVSVADEVTLRNRHLAVLADLFRDIFGNPFRSTAINRWMITKTVTNLAREIYEGRYFDRLPILADALEDAGCTDADILNHCRQPGEHVRGCWVIDLILSKDR